MTGRRVFRWFSSESVIALLIVLVGGGIGVYVAEQRLETAVDHLAERVTRIEDRVEDLNGLKTDIAVIQTDLRHIRESVATLSEIAASSVSRNRDE